jgi:hypothetical protein
MQELVAMQACHKKICIQIISSSMSLFLPSEKILGKQCKYYLHLHEKRWFLPNPTSQEQRKVAWFLISGFPTSSCPFKD